MFLKVCIVIWQVFLLGMVSRVRTWRNRPWWEGALFPYEKVLRLSLFLPLSVDL